MLGLALPAFLQITWAPVVRCSHLLARYSYGIYLSHMIALAISLHYLTRQPLWVKSLSFLSAVTLLSFAFFHLVEKPCIRVGARVARHLSRTASARVTERELNLQPAP